jgi:hypothetical protein
VVEHISEDAPWGDLEEFRQAVHLPLHGQVSSQPDVVDAHQVTLDPVDVKPIRDVLDGLGESIAGGVPWVAMTDQEREAVERLISRL